MYDLKIYYKQILYKVIIVLFPEMFILSNQYFPQYSDPQKCKCPLTCVSSTNFSYKMFRGILGLVQFYFQEINSIKAPHL